MKKIVLMMMVLMSMTAATAQDTEKKAPKAKQVMTQGNKDRMMAPKTPMTIEERTDRTARMLELNDEQKEKMLQLNKDYDSQLQNILTQEQYKKYQQMQSFTSRAHGRGAGPGRGHGGRPMGPRPEKAPAEGAPQE